jgi:hypothetical protein
MGGNISILNEIISFPALYVFQTVEIKEAN